MEGKVCILGSFNVDVVANVEKFPKPGESVIASKSLLLPGGKGANQAKAVTNSRGKVFFFCKIGKDYFGSFAREYLSKTSFHYIKIFESEDEPTGNAMIYVSQENAENTIAIYPGANNSITNNEVMEMKDVLSKVDVLLIQLETNFHAIFMVMKLAKSYGITVILNPAPYSDKIMPFLPYIDIIIPNETEASLMTGINVIDLESAKKAAQIISDKGIKTVIITMGSKGSLVYENNLFKHILAFSANPVDSTGAGDAFIGAFASEIAAKKPTFMAASYASAFASLAVELEGASNMPTYEQVVTKLNGINKS